MFQFSLDGLFYTLLAWNTVGGYWNINVFHFKVCKAMKSADKAKPFTFMEAIVLHFHTLYTSFYGNINKYNTVHKIRTRRRLPNVYLHLSYLIQMFCSRLYYVACNHHTLFESYCRAPVPLPNLHSLK